MENFFDWYWISFAFLNTIVGWVLGDVQLQLKLNMLYIIWLAKSKILHLTADVLQAHGNVCVSS